MGEEVVLWLKRRGQAQRLPNHHLRLTPDSLQSSDYVATAEKLLQEAEHAILAECGARRHRKAWVVRSASMQQVRDSIDACCLDNVASPGADYVAVQIPGREQRSCPECFTSCLSSGLLLLAGISPKPGRCQTVLLIAVLCLASIRAATCWAKMFSHESYGFSSLECTVRAFQSTCALALIAQAHRRGLAELVTKQIRSAAGDDFMKPWMDSQKSSFAVILAYLLLHFLHVAASYRLSAHCDPSGGLSSLCVECAGGLFHAGLAHCTLHLNSFLMHYMDFFADVCRNSANGIGKAETTWTYVAAFASTISRLTGAVYLFVMAFAVLEAAPALGQLLLDAESLKLGCGFHWLVPSLSSAATNLALALYVWRSAVKVTQKCECATSFANHVLSLTSSLPMAKRQGLVLHLQLSDAGIRVSGMKITGAVMLKMLSVLITVALAVVMQITSWSQPRQERLQIVLKQTLDAVISG
ncbi:unnamed protein product [Symbiodinium sp. CCMP2592]|nr:unnamed protein product [Symbiodinium sp. CCMP2592]